MLLAGIIAMAGCDSDLGVTGVHSNDPGILRIYLKSADSDTSIIIAGDTLTVGEGVDDFLGLTIEQGRAYADGNFAILYKGLDESSCVRTFTEDRSVVNAGCSYLEVIGFYDIIARENNKYVEFLIFETYLPPATYDSLRIVINAQFLLLGTFQIPIVTPPDIGPIAKFEQRFDIKENRITEVRLQLKPFKSMERRGDAYHFFRDIEVVEISNL